jgi:hypothetical protein
MVARHDRQATPARQVAELPGRILRQPDTELLHARAGCGRGLPRHSVASALHRLNEDVLFEDVIGFVEAGRDDRTRVVERFLAQLANMRRDPRAVKALSIAVNARLRSGSSFVPLDVLAALRAIHDRASISALVEALARIPPTRARPYLRRWTVSGMRPSNRCSTCCAIPTVESETEPSWHWRALALP